MPYCGAKTARSERSFKVSVVQNPTLSLAGDVAATRMILDAQDQPAILVGHSYGGVVITEAGNHEKVAALVYIAAFAPDKGESVSKLIANPAPGAPVPPILPPHPRILPSLPPHPRLLPSLLPHPRLQPTPRHPLGRPATSDGWVCATATTIRS